MLDFIGQHREEFRFDAHPRRDHRHAPRSAAPGRRSDGFPFLPSGCALQLDAVARDQVLRVAAQRLAEERGGWLPSCAGRLHARPSASLERFLDESGRELEDVYDAGGWTTLRRRAGVDAGVRDEDTEDLSRRLGRLLHVDEPDALARLPRRRAAPRREGRATGARAARPRAGRTCSSSSSIRRGVLRAAEETVRVAGDRPAIAAELDELARSSRTASAWPTRSTRRPSGRSRCIATTPPGDRRGGRVRDPGNKGSLPQGGILPSPETASCCS